MAKREGLKVIVLKTIDKIEKKSINSLANDGFFTYEWFKTVEISDSFEILPYYFVVYDKGSIIAIAPCFIEHNSQYFTLEDKIPLMSEVRKMSKRLGFYLNPPLICHSPSSFHSKILLENGVDGKMILNMVSAKIDNLCHKQRILASAFLFVSEFDELLTWGLQNLGYLKVPLMHTLYLDIQWSNFDDYLDSLRYKVRKNIRREIKKCREHGVIIDREHEFSVYSTELSDLYSNLYSKFRRSRERARNPLDASFFRNLGEYARNKTRMFIAKKDGKIVGFSLCLRQGDVLDVYVAGFDYDYLTKMDFTYFNIGYYEPIKLAIEEGVKKIHFRGSGVQLKLKRGCKLERIYMFVKFQSRFLRNVAHGILAVRETVRRRTQSWS